MCTRVVVRLGLGLALAAFTSWAMAADEPVSDHVPAEEATASEAATPGAAQPEHNGGKHESDHGGGVDPLAFKADLAIWTAAVFLVVLLVLWKFAWGPIVAGLDKREQGIAEQIASAERTNEEARRLLADYQAKLAQSGEEVRQMLDDAKRDAHRVGQQIVAGAKEDAQAEHRRALAEIEMATDAALKELAERSASLAVELAGKIIEARLDPAAHSRLIEQAVARFTRTEPGHN